MAPNLTAAAKPYLAEAVKEDDPLLAIFNLNINQIVPLLQNSDITLLQNAANNPAFTQQPGIDPNVAVAVNQLAQIAGDLNVTAGQLRAVAKRAVIVPLYQELKSYLCCDYSAASDDLFVAWTTVGCLAFALVTFCSARIIYKSPRSCFGRCGGGRKK